MTVVSNSRAKVFLGRWVFFIHLASMGWLLLGWLLPLQLLIFHILSIPAVVLQWRFNNNQCVLTQLQYKIEGRELDPKQEGTFIKDLFARADLYPTKKTLVAITYGLLALAGVLSCVRLFILN